MPLNIVAGFAVHFLTAAGAICGLAALHFAALHQWASSFLWLGAAAVIDAVDGPIARKLKVETNLPRFSGARLDLVVDYLNYCFIPAFIVLESGRAGENWGAAAGAIMLLGSLFHFADLESKTKDGYFIGFPAIWNAVCLYFFVFDTGPGVTLAAIFALSGLTFVPLKWVHPLRASRWRNATLVITLLWSTAALHETISGFPGLLISRVIMAAAAVYLVLVGLSRSFAAGADGSETRRPVK